MKSGKNSVTLIIHTKNEEKNIKDCINSAKDIADEILLVDMQSNDNTISIARKLGARIISISDYGFTDPARNLGMSKVETKWIFSLDADERLTEKLTNKVLQIVEEDKYDVVQFPFKNFIFNKWIKHTGWWPDYHPRLFKKGFLVWPKNVAPHQPAEIKGKILTLEATEENAVVHYNISTVDDFLKKMYRHIGKDVFFKKHKLNTENVMNYVNGQFRWRYFDQKGYLDGTHGFVLSKLMEYYWFLHFLKYWESKNYPDFIDPKILMKHIFHQDAKEYHIKSKIKRVKEILIKKFRINLGL